VGEGAQSEVERRVAEELELLPSKEHRRALREGEEAARRADRRARTGGLDHALQLAGLWYRDVACVLDGAEGLVHHTDRIDALREDARLLGTSHSLRDAVGYVDEARAALVMLNATAELVSEALAFRLERQFAVSRH
jgi:DNA polymerase-3 subunit delta'